MAVASNITSVNTGAFDRIAAMYRGIGERFAQYKVYRETFSELANLSDRELSDLGLYRADIKRLAIEAAYKN